MSEVGMENDGAGHTHVWERDGGPCVCGQSMPDWLLSAWERYAEKTGE